MQSSLPALHSALPAAAPCRAQHFPCALLLLCLFMPRAHSVPHGSPHLRDSALLWSHTSLLPTAQCQLRASIALPAPGCPLVMYPMCHWAALHQQQGRTGAPSGQQHGRCWGWKKVKKNGEGENKRRGPCGYCHVLIYFKSRVLRLFLNGQWWFKCYLQKDFLWSCAFGV